ncbi:hypothetical protein J7K44_02645 [bacterium]|nr:hypothetical protein [bacterium]
MEKFLKEFPIEMERKGWALYLMNRDFSPYLSVAIGELKEIVAQGRIREIKQGKKYIVLPRADNSKSIDDVLSLWDITLFPPYYFNPVTNIVFPIDYLIVTKNGILIYSDIDIFLELNQKLILRDFSYLKQFLPVKIISVVSLAFFKKPEDLLERFSQWEGKDGPKYCNA